MKTSDNIRLIRIHYVQIKVVCLGPCPIKEKQKKFPKKTNRISRILRKILQNKKVYRLQQR